MHGDMSELRDGLHAVYVCCSFELSRELRAMNQIFWLCFGKKMGGDQGRWKDCEMHFLPVIDLCLVKYRDQR